jgi:hypothetical protein
MKTQFLVIVVVLLFSSTSFAQGEYLKRGESAYGFNFGVTSTDIITDFSIFTGISVGGISDFGVGFSLPIGNYSDENIQFLLLAALHPIKQDKLILPFGISLLGTLTFNEYAIGGAVYRNISLNNNFTIQPFGQFSFMKEMSERELTGWVHGAGMTFYMDTGQKVIIKIDFFKSIASKNGLYDTFGVGLGVISRIR